MMDYVTRDEAQGWMHRAVADAQAKAASAIRKQEDIRGRLKKLNRQAETYAANLADINRQRDELLNEQIRLMKRELFS